MSRNRALIEFAYAAETDDEWSTLRVTSREMLAVERTVKGFTANSFFADVSVAGLYRIAWVVLRLRETIDKTVTFDEFTNTHDVKFGAAPVEGTGDSPNDDESDEVGSEADPTRPTA